jgi:hypothetical protein
MTYSVKSLFVAFPLFLIVFFFHLPITSALVVMIHQLGGNFLIQQTLLILLALFYNKFKYVIMFQLYHFILNFLNLNPIMAAIWHAIALKLKTIFISFLGHYKQGRASLWRVKAMTPPSIINLHKLTHVTCYLNTDCQQITINHIYGFRIVMIKIKHC